MILRYIVFSIKRITQTPSIYPYYIIYIYTIYVIYNNYLHNNDNILCDARLGQLESKWPVNIWLNMRLKLWKYSHFSVYTYIICFYKILQKHSLCIRVFYGLTQYNIIIILYRVILLIVNIHYIEKYQSSWNYLLHFLTNTK